MRTLVLQVYAFAGHAHVGTCTCINSAIDLVHGFVNMHAAQPSVWHFSALVSCMQLFLVMFREWRSTYSLACTCTVCNYTMYVTMCTCKHCRRRVS